MLSTQKLSFNLYSHWGQYQIHKRTERYRERQQENKLPDRKIDWLLIIMFGEKVKEDLIEKVINIERNVSILPTLSGDFDTLNLKEVYKGSDHPLQLMIKTRQTAVCSFPNIQYYPFREETCFIQFYIQGKDLKGR